MQRRDIAILAVIIVLFLFFVASFAPVADAPILVSPLVLQSPAVTPLANPTLHFVPLLMCDASCPTARPTLPGPTNTPTPRGTP